MPLNAQNALEPDGKSKPARLRRRTRKPAVWAGGIFAAGCALLAGVALLWAPRPAAPAPAPFHFRAVWIQDRAGMRDVHALGSDRYLMGMDSRRGGRERPLLRTPGRYCRPLLTDDGQTVVYSDRRTGGAHALRWGGRKPRFLGPGRALDTWTDPATKLVWVALGDGADPHPRLHRRIRLVRLDDPAIHRDLGLEFAVNENNFQFHDDGRLASGDRAGAGCGFVDLETGEWRQTADGCWPTMAPAGPPVVAVLQDGHRTLELVSVEDRRRIRIDAAAGIDPAAGEVFHPRWTNRRTHMALSGPYSAGTGRNRIGNGGPAVEIHLLEFTDDLAALRATYPITRNGFADFQPDIWIAPGD